MFEDAAKKEMKTGSLDPCHGRSTEPIAEPEMTPPQNGGCSRQNGMKLEGQNISYPIDAFINSVPHSDSFC